VAEALGDILADTEAVTLVLCVIDGEGVTDIVGVTVFVIVRVGVCDLVGDLLRPEVTLIDEDILMEAVGERLEGGVIVGNGVMVGVRVIGFVGVTVGVLLGDLVIWEVRVALIE
jgi:hypothetical protein